MTRGDSQDTQELERPGSLSTYRPLNVESPPRYTRDLGRGLPSLGSKEISGPDSVLILGLGPESLGEDPGSPSGLSPGRFWETSSPTLGSPGGISVDWSQVHTDWTVFHTQLDYFYTPTTYTPLRRLQDAVGRPTGLPRDPHNGSTLKCLTSCRLLCLCSCPREPLPFALCVCVAVCAPCP